MFFLIVYLVISSQFCFKNSPPDVDTVVQRDVVYSNANVCFFFFSKYLVNFRSELMHTSGFWQEIEVLLTLLLGDRGDHGNEVDWEVSRFSSQFSIIPIFVHSIS